MLLQDSVSQWIVGLKSGEFEAVQKLWDRYKRPLLRIAQRRLRGFPARIADEEDIAQSVIMSLCRGAAAGRLEDIKSRDDLWWLLLAMTRRKTVDLIRKEKAKKRGGGRVLSERSPRATDSPGWSMDDLIGRAPTPEFLVLMDEQYRCLLGLLANDGLKTIASSRVEGYTVAEIAANLSVSNRSVERKLSLIRKIWTAALIKDQ